MAEKAGGESPEKIDWVGLTPEVEMQIRGLVTRVLVMVVLAVPAFSQLPDKFTNLKVLPKDIDKKQLFQTMKMFALGLGVRCEHCHVGEPGAPLASFDFANDTKRPKQNARVMYGIMQELNTQKLTQLKLDAGEQAKVTCYSCHRGKLKPETDAPLPPMPEKPPEKK